MDEFEIRALQWEDIPKLAQVSSDWLSINGNYSSITILMHQFSDFCLGVESNKHEIKAVICATINTGLPESVVIQNVLIDSKIVGTGTFRLLLAKLSAVAKEKGCQDVRVVLPIKSHTFLSLFTLSGYSPVNPPRQLEVGKLSQGNFAVKPGSIQDPALWWKDYFGIKEHGVMLKHDL